MWRYLPITSKGNFLFSFFLCFSNFSLLFCPSILGCCYYCVCNHQIQLCRAVKFIDPCGCGCVVCPHLASQSLNKATVCQFLCLPTYYLTWDSGFTGSFTERTEIIKYILLCPISKLSRDLIPSTKNDVYYFTLPISTKKKKKRQEECHFHYFIKSQYF